MHVKKSVIFEEKFPTYQMIFQSLFSLHGAILDILTRFEIKLTNEMCWFLSICAHAAVFDMLILAMKISNFRKKNFISYQLFLVRRAKFITKSISRLGARQITRIDLGGRSNACRGNNLPNVTARTFFLQVIPF